MPDHRVAREAESDLTEIWKHIVETSGSFDVADRFIDSLTSRFVLLASQPEMGRRRDDDLRPGLRTFAVGKFVIAYRIEDDCVVILRVLRGARNLQSILGD